MARPILEIFFKKFLESLKSNKNFREELNKQANHYFEEDIENLKSQITLVDSKREAEFNKKYAQALQTLKDKGMSDLTFAQISRGLREKFLSHFTELKELGIDTGHVFGNLTVASKSKATKEIFEGTSLQVSEYGEIQEISDKDLRDISKTIALISTYTSTLEELDKIQNRAGFIKFLKKSKSFKNVAVSQNLSTLEGIKNAVSIAFPGDSKGLRELGGQVLRSQVLTISPSTTASMARTITASDKNIAVTFEVAAFNQYKGNIAAAIKNEFTALLSKQISEGTISRDLDKALEAAIIESFTKKDLMELFPKVQASKSVIEAITDIVVENIAVGKSKPYKSSKQLPSKTEALANISIKIPEIKLKKIKVREPVIRNKQTGKFTSLASLQLLLNSALRLQIQRNMGSGNRKDVLNYRTGRFAESAKVERLSQSREGMITAFYSYMKYPYQTFEPGFRQGSPKSRDPKLLISKSVREIAATMVGNRLRAVRL